MGMMVDSGSAISQLVEFRSKKAKTAGAVYSTAPAKKTEEKKKKLYYNFKKISSALLTAKTSVSAGRVLTTARGEVAMLKRKLRSGEYNDKEVENAIIHAEKMAMIAKKKLKHLKEEEEGARSQETELENTELTEDFETEDDMQRMQEMTQEEMEQMLQEYQECMEEVEKELEETVSEMEEELMGAIQEDMSPEDLEQLKKKHRAKELKEITEADMKYLKALFDQLEKEKQDGGDLFGVSLELEGMDIPVQVEMPVMEEGANMDVSI